MKQQFEPRNKVTVHLNDEEDTVCVRTDAGDYELSTLLDHPVIDDDEIEAVNSQLVEIINARNFMKFQEELSNESELGDHI